jgi:hypothetical protein
MAGERIVSHVYLVVSGHKMSEHAMDDARRQDQVFRSYLRDAAGTPTSELDQLSHKREYVDGR